MRGDGGYAYRILAVGGSTTICVVLDDEEAWPHAAQEIVNRRLGARTLVIGNVGRPGHPTVAHRLQLEKLLDQYEELDAVLLLTGGNDLVIGLNILRGFVTLEPGRDPDRMLRAVFSVVPAERDGPWYARSSLLSWLTGRLARTRTLARDWPVLDPRGDLYRRLGHYRRTAGRLVDELPELRPMLESYEGNLNAIVDLARAKDVRPILITQPSLWREGLTEEAEDRLWSGGPPLDQLREGAGVFDGPCAGGGDGSLQRGDAPPLRRAWRPSASTRRASFPGSSRCSWTTSTTPSAAPLAWRRSSPSTCSRPHRSRVRRRCRDPRTPCR